MVWCSIAWLPATTENRWVISDTIPATWGSMRFRSAVLRISLGVIAACAPLASGCGQRTVRYEMLPVEGVVTLEGEPLANAEVLFDSVDGPRGFGLTDEAGRFTVITRQYGPGLPAGTYKVFVTGTEKTRLAGSSRPVQLATVYGESGVGRVTIEAENKPLAFDLERKPGGGRVQPAEEAGGA